MSTFIKWTSEDDEGTFSHVGELFRRKDGVILMQLNGGGMVELEEGDGVTEVVEKPADWNMPEVSRKATEGLREKKEAAPKRTPKPRQETTSTTTGTKKDKAIAIARELGIDKKDEIIARFESELNMSRAGAMTYYYTCKKTI